MTPLKLMKRSRQNAIEHCKLLVQHYNIESDEIYGEMDFLNALEKVEKQ